MRKKERRSPFPTEGFVLISYMPLTLNLFQKNKIFDLNSADREGCAEQ